MSVNLLVSTKITGQKGLARTLLGEWRMVCLEENGSDLTFIDLFNGLVTHLFDAHDTFALPLEFVNQPVT